MTIRGIVVFIILTVAPLVPLMLALRPALGGGDAGEAITARVRVEMALTILNFLLLVCSFIWMPVLGSYYSQRRLGTIYTSLVLMVLVAIASAVDARRLRRFLTVAAIILALEWAYMAVVNSVV